jgi:hypothetical protein
MNLGLDEILSQRHEKIKAEINRLQQKKSWLIITKASDKLVRNYERKIAQLQKKLFHPL